MNTRTDILPESLIRRMIRPLVSMLIKNSVSYQRFNRLLKETYVDVAAAEYGKGGRPTNVSRISLLTGLDRKYVKAARDEQKSASTEESRHPQSQSGALGGVLSAWHQDPEYSSDGHPLALTVNIGFRSLCKRYGGDITHTAILNELMRVKAVKSLPDGTVIANSRYYMPALADPRTITRSCDVYTDVGHTLLHNLYRPAKEPSRFEGRATNPRIPITRVEDFRNLVETKGQHFLEEIDSCLSQYEQENNRHGSQEVRLGLGIYWIEDQEETAP